MAEYAYDGLFRRTVKTEFESGQGHERHFYYSSHWQVVEERGSETGGVQQHFIWGLLGVDDLVLRDQAATPLPPRLYALHDTMHVTAITDAAGTVLERYGYDAFGGTRVMDASFNDRSGSDYHWETRFCGYRWDGETGLYQVRYRYLHSGLGRWLSRDPMGFRMDEMNLYAYVGGNSVNRLDLLGLGDCPCDPADVDEVVAEANNEYLIYTIETGREVCAYICCDSDSGDPYLGYVIYAAIGKEGECLIGKSLCIGQDDIVATWHTHPLGEPRQVGKGNWNPDRILCNGMHVPSFMCNAEGDTTILLPGIPGEIVIPGY